MEYITIEELNKVNDFIEEGIVNIYLSDVLGAIEDLSYGTDKVITADEIIEYLK